MTHSEEAAAARGPEHFTRRRRRRRRVVVAVALAAATALGAGLLACLMLCSHPGEPLEQVTAGGVTFTANVPITEYRGVPYAQLAVNADVAETTIEVPEPADRARIRAFLDGLDTLVPGKHVVELSTGDLHVIVDGMGE